MTCKRIRMNNPVLNLLVVNGVLCLSSTYVVGLCVGNDVILVVGYVTLIFLNAVEEERLVIPSNVFGVCLSLFLRVY